MLLGITSRRSSIGGTRKLQAAQNEWSRPFAEATRPATIAEAIAEDVPVPVISAALYARFASRQDESFAAKINAALRNQFGGHAVKAEK